MRRKDFATNLSKQCRSGPHRHDTTHDVTNHLYGLFGHALRVVMVHKQ